MIDVDLGDPAVKPARRRLVEDSLRLDLGDLLRVCQSLTPTPEAWLPTSLGVAVFPALAVPVTRRGVAVGRVMVDILRTGRHGQMQIIAGPGCGTTAELRADAARLIGFRWGLCCPLTGRRCRVLYLPPGAAGFGSWQAHGLTYGSLYEHPVARRYRRAARLRRYLGEVPAVVSGPLPDAPAGMRGATYARRCAEIQAVEGLLEVA